MKLHAESHVDHFGPSTKVIPYLLDRFSQRDGFFIETIELPERFGFFRCHLHGPAVGTEPVTDEEAYEGMREGRDFPHRMCSRKPIATRFVTVIAGPHDGEPCVLYTAYPGPPSPKSPNDPELRDDERDESIKFWAVHALSK